jgi:hypothetical protein
VEVVGPRQGARSLTYDCDGCADKASDGVPDAHEQHTTRDCERAQHSSLIIASSQRPPSNPDAPNDSFHSVKLPGACPLAGLNSDLRFTLKKIQGKRKVTPISGCRVRISGQPSAALDLSFPPGFVVSPTHAPNPLSGVRSHCLCAQIKPCSRGGYGFHFPDSPCITSGLLLLTREVGRHRSFDRHGLVVSVGPNLRRIIPLTLLAASSLAHSGMRRTA